MEPTFKSEMLRLHRRKWLTAGWKDALVVLVVVAGLTALLYVR